MGGALGPGVRLRVIPLLRGADAVDVLDRPVSERLDRFAQADAEFGQFVINPRRDGRGDGAGEEAVAFEAAQAQRQHALGNAIDRAFEFGEAFGAAVSSGGFYDEGNAMEHVETYPKGVFGFIGVTPEFVHADGIAIGPEQREAGIANGLAEVVALAA